MSSLSPSGHLWAPRVSQVSHVAFTLAQMESLGINPLQTCAFQGLCSKWGVEVCFTKQA